MSTDEIRRAFHDAFEPVVGDVRADPTLAGTVRRRYAREQRLMTVGAVLGVAVVTAGAAITTYSLSTGPERDVAPVGQDTATPTSEPTPTPTPEAWRVVSLVGHPVSVPADWRLSGNRDLIDLDTIQPPQPVGGRDQSVTATSPDRSQRFEATVYSGPMAEMVHSMNAVEGDPDFTRVPIDGRDAWIRVVGPATTCIHAETPGGEPTEGPCPTPDPPDARYGQVAYAFPNGDFMEAYTDGMDTAELAAFLEEALSR